jgi:hypothetical protein
MGRCSTSVVTLKRAELIKAMTDDKLELQLDKHSVACVVDRERGADQHHVRFFPAACRSKRA